MSKSNEHKHTAIVNYTVSIVATFTTILVRNLGDLQNLRKQQERCKANINLAYSK